MSHPTEHTSSAGQGEPSKSRLLARPAWQYSESCFECGVKFTFRKRASHCRFCGHRFCRDHITKRLPIPELEFFIPVKVCDECSHRLHIDGHAHDDTTDHEGFLQSDTNVLTHESQKSGPSRKHTADQKHDGRKARKSKTRTASHEDGNAATSLNENSQEQMSQIKNGPSSTFASNHSSMTSHKFSAASPSNMSMAIPDTMSSFVSSKTSLTSTTSTTSPSHLNSSHDKRSSHNASQSSHMDEDKTKSADSDDIVNRNASVSTHTGRDTQDDSNPTSRESHPLGVSVTIPTIGELVDQHLLQFAMTTRKSSAVSADAMNKIFAQSLSNFSGCASPTSVAETHLGLLISPILHQKLNYNSIIDESFEETKVLTQKDNFVGQDRNENEKPTQARVENEKPGTEGTKHEASERVLNEESQNNVSQIESTHNNNSCNDLPNESIPVTTVKAGQDSHGYQDLILTSTLSNSAHAENFSVEESSSATELSEIQRIATTARAHAKSTAYRTNNKSSPQVLTRSSSDGQTAPVSCLTSASQQKIETSLSIRTISTGAPCADSVTNQAVQGSSVEPLSKSPDTGDDNLGQKGSPMAEADQIEDESNQRPLSHVALDDPESHNEVSDINSSQLKQSRARSQVLQRSTLLTFNKRKTSFQEELTSGLESGNSNGEYVHVQESCLKGNEEEASHVFNKEMFRIDSIAAYYSNLDIDSGEVDFHNCGSHDNDEEDDETVANPPPSVCTVESCALSGVPSQSQLSLALEKHKTQSSADELMKQKSICKPSPSIGIPISPHHNNNNNNSSRSLGKVPEEDEARDENSVGSTHSVKSSSIGSSDAFDVLEQEGLCDRSFMEVPIPFWTSPRLDPSASVSRDGHVASDDIRRNPFEFVKLNFASLKTDSEQKASKEKRVVNENMRASQVESPLLSDLLRTLVTTIQDSDAASEFRQQFFLFHPGFIPSRTLAIALSTAYLQPPVAFVNDRVCALTKLHILKMVTLWCRMQYEDASSQCLFFTAITHPQVETAPASSGLDKFFTDKASGFRKGELSMKFLSAKDCLKNALVVSCQTASLHGMHVDISDQVLARLEITPYKRASFISEEVSNDILWSSKAGQETDRIGDDTAVRSKLWNVFDQPVEAIAGALTVRHLELFGRVRLRELMNKNWTRTMQAPISEVEKSTLPEGVSGVPANKKTKTIPPKFAPNLYRLIKESDAIAVWTCSSILDATPSRIQDGSFRQIATNARLQRLVLFVLICLRLLWQRNFFALSAIVNGLSLSPLARIKALWERVPQPILSTLTRLRDFIGASSDWNQYRETLKLCQTSGVKYLPALICSLKDAFFVEESCESLLGLGRGFNMFSDPTGEIAIAKIRRRAQMSRGVLPLAKQTRFGDRFNTAPLLTSNRQKEQSSDNEVVLSLNGLVSSTSFKDQVESSYQSNLLDMRVNWTKHRAFWQIIDPILCSIKYAFELGAVVTAASFISIECQEKKSVLPFYPLPPNHLSQEDSDLDIVRSQLVFGAGYVGSDDLLECLQRSAVGTNLSNDEQKGLVQIEKSILWYHMYPLCPANFGSSASGFGSENEIKPSQSLFSSLLPANPLVIMKPLQEKTVKSLALLDSEEGRCLIEGKETVVLTLQNQVSDYYRQVDLTSKPASDSFMSAFMSISDFLQNLKTVRDIHALPQFSNASSVSEKLNTVFKQAFTASSQSSLVSFGEVKVYPGVPELITVRTENGSKGDTKIAPIFSALPWLELKGDLNGPITPYAFAIPPIHQSQFCIPKAFNGNCQVSMSNSFIPFPPPGPPPSPPSPAELCSLLMKGDQCNESFAIKDEKYEADESECKDDIANEEESTTRERGLTDWDSLVTRAPSLSMTGSFTVVSSKNVIDDIMKSESSTQEAGDNNTKRNDDTNNNINTRTAKVSQNTTSHKQETAHLQDELISFGLYLETNVNDFVGDKVSAGHKKESSSSSVDVTTSEKNRPSDSKNEAPKQSFFSRLFKKTDQSKQQEQQDVLKSQSEVKDRREEEGLKLKADASALDSKPESAALERVSMSRSSGSTSLIEEVDLPKHFPSSGVAGSTSLTLLYQSLSDSISKSTERSEVDLWNLSFLIAPRDMKQYHTLTWKQADEEERKRLVSEQQSFVDAVVKPIIEARAAREEEEKRLRAAEDIVIESAKTRLEELRSWWGLPSQVGPDSDSC